MIKGVDEIMSVFKVSNLSKTYNGKTYVFKNLSFKIEEGEIVGIIGESGAGKTTLLNLLSGLDRPSDGEILYNNNKMNDFSQRNLTALRRREFGYIFQFFNLIDFLNVEENILLPSIFDKNTTCKNSIDNILNYFGIYNRRSSYPNELSGGEKQRVAIARAISYNPSVIFADEPTGNLDKKAAEEIINIIFSCKKKYNQTLLIVTHDTSLYKHFTQIIELRKK